MNRRQEWAVVLAGGEGSRLRELTRLIAGDERPKQFCRLLGPHTLLTATRQRVGLTVNPNRILYVVTRHHEPFYRAELEAAPPHRIVEQPTSRGTTTAIAYALARVTARVRNPVLGFFPADHHYEHPLECQRSIGLAYAAASRDADRVYLIGAEAHCPETEYGWIEPGPPVPIAANAGARQVAGFVEKPSELEATALLQRQCLWNTFMLVGQASAFVALLDRAVPGLYAKCVAANASLEPATATAAIEDLYQQVPASDFSRDVLTTQPDRLAVINLPAAGWTDLGQPSRVLEAMASRERVRTASLVVAS